MLRELPEAERPVALVSYDEKPRIQAVATTAPDLPPRPGKHATVQLDHNTNGWARSRFPRPSTSLRALCTMPLLSVTAREFVSFLQHLDAAYPAGLLICILLDNHSAHRSRETQRFLERRRPKLIES
jgi:hypothetical protein